MQHLISPLTRHGGVGPVVPHVHSSEFLTLQSSHLGEESDDVHFVDLVLTPLAYI